MVISFAANARGGTAGAHHRNTAGITAIILAGCGLASPPARGLDSAVPRVGGDVSRTMLGDGTGVIVGIVDSGVDDTHPGLAGTDSQGMPRLVAEANVVPTEPGLSADDVFGHGTFVTGIVMSSDATFTGMAPDARYVNARSINVNNGFDTTTWIEDGAGFAIDNGATILNFSLGTFASLSSGTLDLDEMLDWASSQRGVISVVSAGNDGNTADPQVGSPAGAFNVVTVGATEAPTYDQVTGFSSTGPTDDGRIKPDIVAPGTSITSLNDDWETGPDFRVSQGTSFAAPLVAGALAQVTDYGLINGLSTDPRVLRATLYNSAEKIADKSGDPWAPDAASDVGGVYTVTSPLNPESGVGQLDAATLAEQYMAGEQGPGTIGELGWDLNIIDAGGTATYEFALDLVAGSDFAATLVWDRVVDLIFDDGDGALDSGEIFSALGLTNLDLALLLDGVEVAVSESTVDSVEHLFFTIPETGAYTLEVRNAIGGFDDTIYGLAWSEIAVPEPGVAVLAAMGLIGFARRGRRSAG